MTIVVSVKDHVMTPHHVTQLRRVVERSLVKHGTSGLSGTGYALVIAVEWCEARQLPYTIKADPGAGYVLTIDRSETDTKDIIDLMAKIVNRALAAEKMDSTDHMTRRVPAGLLDEASELLASLGR